MFLKDVTPFYSASCGRDHCGARDHMPCIEILPSGPDRRVLS